MGLQPQEAPGGQRHSVGAHLRPLGANEVLQAGLQGLRVALRALHQADAVQMLGEQCEPGLVVARGQQQRTANALYASGSQQQRTFNQTLTPKYWEKQCNRVLGTFR